MTIVEATNKSVKDQAQEEIMKELNEEAITRYKEKLKELHSAKKIVKNIQRDLEDLGEEIEQDIEDLKE